MDRYTISHPIRFIPSARPANQIHSKRSASQSDSFQALGSCFCEKYMKNYDLSQDQFFIYNALIDIPLKKNTYIIFEYIFQAEYIDIPLIINLKIDNVLEKDFHINLKKYNKIRHMFKLDYNITKINFYMYLFNNEIYNDEKMVYLKKILFNNKIIKFHIFSLI